MVYEIVFHLSAFLILRYRSPHTGAGRRIKTPAGRGSVSLFVGCAGESGSGVGGPQIVLIPLTRFRVIISCGSGSGTYRMPPVPSTPNDAPGGSRKEITRRLPLGSEPS